MTKKKKQPKTDQTKPKGQSKYALKVQRRKRICKIHGIPDTPFPVLWVNGIN